MTPHDSLALTVARISGLVMAVLVFVILMWLLADDLYARKLWFRRAWDRTGLRFPHTAFSPYWKG